MVQELSAERRSLLAQQTALLRALVAEGPCPSGFDASRVKAAARSLARKRLREVAEAWPVLVRDLGEAFEPLLTAFAADTARPAWGGPLADGFAFANTLPADRISDDTRLGILGARLRYRCLGTGLRPRRCLALATVWLPEARQLMVGLRLPWLGSYILRLPLRRLQPRVLETPPTPPA
jgi:hypothetical protein